MYNGVGPFYGFLMRQTGYWGDTLAGSYTPKSGRFAGQTFANKRAYVTASAKLEGYASHEERTAARKEQKEFQDLFDIKTEKTQRKSSGKIVDNYRGDNIADMLSFAANLAPNAVVSIRVQTNTNLSTSKTTREYTGWSTLVTKTKVSKFKADLNSGSLRERIDDALQGVDNILDVEIYVSR